MTYKVLIAVDGSIYADYAVQWYIAHIHQPGYHPILAHVGEMAISPSFGFRAGMAIPREQWKMMLHEQEEKVKAILKKHADQMAAAAITDVKCISESGNPGQHLVDISNKQKCQLLVIGTRGQGTVARTILGSVSDYVLHHATIPVCIVRAPDTTHGRDRTGSSSSTGKSKAGQDRTGSSSSTGKSKA